jgi:hypothetical protein
MNTTTLKLTMSMIAKDSKWGPWFRGAINAEETDWVCDRAQEEWNRLHSNRHGIPCTIITMFGTYEL